MMKNYKLLVAIAGIGAALLFAAYPVRAQLAKEKVDELDGVGITEKLKERIPLDLEFMDDGGQTVTLSKYFGGEKPALITLVYSRCPILCGFVLNALVESLKELPLTPGKDFEIVKISFNPLETPTLARLKKQNYLTEYGKPGAGSGWHFLTGKQEEITRITDALGFGYKYDTESDQYIHTAALMILTPDGTVSRYIYGVMYDPKTLRLSLSEASQGRIGSPLDKIILYCFHYDPAKGSYVPFAMNLMRLGGALIVLLVAGILSGVVFAKSEERKRQIAGNAGTTGGAGSAGSAAK